MRWRVVCTLGDTMLTFPPTKVLSRVDLPTFGLPAKAMKPQHVSGSGFIQRFQETRSRILLRTAAADRKSTRLNSSHVAISYAVFCLKKKKDVMTVNHE